MTRKEFAGGAPATTLNGAINNSVLALTLTSGTGYPTGTNPFVLCIDRGELTEEKVLCSARSGTGVTITTRGYDGTSAVSHSDGATVEHTLDAVTIDEANKHANDGDTVAHAASKISFSPTGTIAATNVQAAVAEVSGDVTSLTTVTDDHETRIDTLETDTLNRMMLSGFVSASAFVTTNSQLQRIGINSSGDPATLAIPILMTRAGSITAIAIVGTPARSSGSLVCEVYKNGVGTGLTATIDGTNTQYAYNAQAVGTDTFVAGDRLDVRATNNLLAGMISFECSIVVIV